MYKNSFEFKNICEIFCNEFKSWSLNWPSVEIFWPVDSCLINKLVIKNSCLVSKRIWGEIAVKNAASAQSSFFRFLVIAIIARNGGIRESPR